ncbi:DEAD/DEAH box helicase [uncultured Microbacterium sp.]|uniref:DEAD/DEAH box helicase n=1 Tax=uncultured Microbacterium sp. TaxID=191216 RepID=UPI0028EFE1E3|nr:DEAD/DEAH box helicase [uncultured Microbacterium sp.]
MAENPTIAETISSIRAALRDYIEATYHVGHPTIIEQRRALLELEGVIHQAPFIESTPRYQTHRRFDDLDLDPAAKTLFRALTSTAAGPQLLHDPPYTHQADALEFTGRDGLSLAVTTGTGSGKTESFLLPMLAKLATEAANRPEVFREPAVRALVLYPMNALVNDQLGRLRLLLGDPRVTELFQSWSGRPARFARYTSRTLYPGVRTVARDRTRLKPVEDFYVDLLDRADDPTSRHHGPAADLVRELQHRGKWPAKPDLRTWYGAKHSHWKKNGEYVRAVTQPADAELFTRHEVLATPPDVLITNYSMLEYMMMRPLERPVFDATRAWLQNNPEEKFLLVIDEAHLYRGAAGAEVALLLRRLRTRLGVSPDRVQVISTSASFHDADYARQFAAQLSGTDAAQFRTVRGDYDLRPHAGVGSASDAEVLAALPLSTFYDAEENEERIAAVSSLLNHRAVSPTSGDTASALLERALGTFEPFGMLVNETMQRAQPVNELGATIFPHSPPETADRAVTALVALGSAARKQVEDAGLLPCRVHSFYRGLPGLWACADDHCTAVDRNAHPTPGPIGKLYAQPQETCDCGSRVFEFYTCRHCGSAYLRAYTDDLSNPESLWNEPGDGFQSVTGPVPKLHPIDLLVETPDQSHEPQMADLDLLTGRLDPRHLGPRVRTVYLSGKRNGEVITTDEDDDDEDDATSVTTSNGEFKPCGVCGRTAGFGRSSVQDHQTKGDQPFQALVTRQIEVQPPSRPYRDFAPLRGRKVLVFSDSRQVAARLAPNLQTYAMQDVIRPLLVRGWSELSKIPGLDRQLGLHFLVLSAFVAAKTLSVRLRPELRQGESMGVLRDVARLVDEGALTGNVAAQTELITLPIQVPDSLMRAIHATLTDRYYGLAPLGLASLRERESDRSALLVELDDIAGIADSDDTKLALVRLWLAQWATPAHGLLFPSMTADWQGVKGGVRPHAGKFRPLERWLATPAAKKTFNATWLPVLRQFFCDPAGDKFYLLAGKVALDIGGNWGYCERCRFTQRAFPGTSRCVNCRTDGVRVIDPDADTVFQTRKGYYRASTTRALGPVGEPPLSIIAAEHSAQLNASRADAVFSRAEEHELLFQDVNIELPGTGSQERAAIDVLSCTTTMEVGIDIGALSGVALRNMPPSRANYQQRAGRAGRRGNAVATVIAFGSADTHDDHYFRAPAEMIRGDVNDPVLTMDNEEIARRHVVAFLLQRYHQDRLPVFDAESQSSQLFEVLGTVAEFTRPESPISRAGFESWLRENEADLRGEIDGWLPTELTPYGRNALLDGIVDQTLTDIDAALELTPDAATLRAEASAGASADDEADADIEPPVEEASEEPSPEQRRRNLLGRLLYRGVLPRYAFPTDVASFHVFDRDRSEPYRPAFQYAPSQGLAVALSQYAPGKTVWIDNKKWRSGAIYSPAPAERREAWKDHKLYFECVVCHYAKYFEQDEARPRQLRNCPACGSEDSFGKAMAWMRPPGFAHPVLEDEGTRPDDAPARSYATRAKLFAPGPEEDSAWNSVTDQVQQTYRREKLIVTNTGPENEGYTYCFTCGRIEPTASPGGIITAPHKKPFPDAEAPDCPGGASWEGLVLGTDFFTDVLLVRFKADGPVRLDPQLLSTQVALRTVAEAMTIAATHLLEIEPNELQAEYRPALTPGGASGREAEVYIYDTLAGGAGFARRVEERGREVLELTLRQLENCPAGCDQSCYRCLRSFRNRFEHGLLDRQVGASLLRYLLYGTTPTLDGARLELSTSRLFHDLAGRDLDGVTFERDVPVSFAGIGQITAPILATKGDRRIIVAVNGSLTPGLALDPLLNEVKEQQSGVPVCLIDDIRISRNLPSASLEVEKYLL